MATASAMAQTIDIKYNGASAEVMIPAEVGDVVYSVSGANVSITSGTASTEYTYHVTGSTSNGSLLINGSYKLTLQLDGANITSGARAAIDVECGKRVAVELVDGTENTITDGKGGTQKAAMYFSGHPEFQGGGTLNVTGNTAHAISAKEYLTVKKSTGTINVLGAVKDGIHCGKGKVSEWGDPTGAVEPVNVNEFFTCKGGVINISNVGGDCIDAGDYGCAYITGGELNLSVTATDVCGVKAVNTFLMTGGSINMDVSASGSDGIYANNNVVIGGGTVNVNVTGDGSKGIKAKLKATTPYAAGGNLTISDGTISILASGGDDNSDPTDPSHCVGISVDGNLNVTGGVAEVITSGTEARGVSCDGVQTGTISVKTNHWGVNPHDYQYSMSMYAVLENTTASQYSNWEIAAFVGNECRGVLSYNAAGYGYMRIYSNVTGGETVSFRAYDLKTGNTYFIQNTVAFSNDGLQGVPSSPIVLKKNGVLGDVNNDGALSIADAVELIAHCVAGTESTLDKRVCDVDGNGTINKDDAVAIVKTFVR